jgi:ubiquitin-activating enzyme E1
MSGGPAHEADAACERLLSEMPTPASLAGYRLNIIDYQKDDLDRYHLEFVTAAANLRARNYGIPPVDKLTARLIAGRILPSVITSASVVAGLMCLELYKLVQNKPLGAYRHGYLNLALPVVAFAQPLEAVKTEVQTTHGKPLVWTLWDRLVFSDSRDWGLEGWLRITTARMASLTAESLDVFPLLVWKRLNRCCNGY